jgi:polyphosphate kinase
MLYDYTHVFPVLNAKVLILGVVTHMEESPLGMDNKKLSFVQLPSNLPRFYQIYRGAKILLLPLEDIVKRYIKKLYRNVDILSISLFRIVRNGDFSLDEIDDNEEDFIDEIKQKIKGRRLGRVVKMEIAPEFDGELLKLLQKRLEIDKYNIFRVDGLLDYTSLWQIVKIPEFKELLPTVHSAVMPLDYGRDRSVNIFDAIKEKDIFLHHPYNGFEPVLHLLEKAAEDPQVLSIKLTIYRVAKKSRVTEALLRAAENGKHVSVLFEVKARFDEENNISEAQKLQKAGCFVIHGIGLLKTHTKLLLIVRKEGDKVVRYAHLSSGNYNEDTARLYTDIGLLTANEEYTYDIAEFFNVITGHSHPAKYRNLITAPRQMRNELISLINNEAENAQKGLPSGICIKINSLEDKEIIYELYRASQAGVRIELIVRGICCLRPGREGLSQNIRVRSIVGDYLEHSRLFYFHNAGDPKVYGGSADVMVRSFDRRIESLFMFVDPKVKQEAINILVYNLRDNQNAYELQEDGTYKRSVCIGEPFNIHKEFYNVTIDDVMAARLFDEPVSTVEDESVDSNEETTLTQQEQNTDNI